jgi:hypothetical protein
MKKIILAALMIAPFLSCSNDDSAAVVEEIVVEVPVEIAFENVSNSQMAIPSTGVSTTVRRNFIINSTADWNTFVNVYNNTTQFSGFNFDFSTSTIIAVIDDFYGEGGGADLNVTSVIQFNNAITVHLERIPPMSTPLIGFAYQPFHIIKIPKTTLPIVFQ